LLIFLAYFNVIPTHGGEREGRQMRRLFRKGVGVGGGDGGRKAIDEIARSNGWE
jgi:hypothetical protein